MIITGSEQQAAATTGVSGAIRTAASATGANFGYLLATAKVESSLDPAAKASTSSARGLFQFIQSTWLSTVKEAGPSLGYGQYANAITKTASGSYQVADPAMRAQILALRDDPAANAAMAGAFTQGNAARLNDTLGRPASEGELYIAHFLGAGGAGKLISLAQSGSGGSAASAFPNAAAANRSVFYERDGRARSASQVYSELTSRYQAARDALTTPAIASVAQSQGIAQPAAAPVSASAGAGQSERTSFKNLFQEPGSRGAVSKLVQELWGSRPHIAAALSGQGAAQTSAAVAPQTPAQTVTARGFGLFGDLGQDGGAASR